jgi:hypothetical protein
LCMKIAAVTAGMIVLSGCSSVEDWTYGSATCQVHQIVMQTKVIHNCKNIYISYTEDYLSASKRLFPNAHPRYGKELYGKRRGKVYVCPMCLKAIELWTAAHQ